MQFLHVKFIADFRTMLMACSGRQFSLCRRFTYRTIIPPTLGEHMEGAGNLREVTDESSVEVHEPYEGLDILDLCWLWPVCDSLDLDRVHRYMVLRDNKPKVVHLLMFELAFLWLEQ